MLRFTRIIFILVFFCFNIISYGQKNFFEGYIIMLSGDTVYGKIKNYDTADEYPGHDKIKFIDKNGNEEKYRADKIKGYSKKGIANYLSIKVSGHGPFFARVLIEGPITLLSTFSYSDSAPYGYVKIPTTVYYLIHVNKKYAHVVNDLQFKADMSNYFSDYPQLQQQILNKELRLADMEIIVKRYNQWYNSK